LIAIVEGLSEFLPISSTGHMIIAEHVLNVPPDAFTKLFTVCIQFGAILSVLVLYWKRFLQGIPFYVKLLIAFVPAAVIGTLFGDDIDLLLENVTVVAVALLLGGIVLLFIDKWLDPKHEVDVTPKRAFTIGLFQCIALIPGVSRSAATIIGGMSQKLTRTQAAEFSFFLAVPTMAAASGYKLLKDIMARANVQEGDHFSDKLHKAHDVIIRGMHSEKFILLIVGNLVAFVVAMLAIKFFIAFLTKHGFRVWGWYRIAVGAVLLVLLACGADLAVV
ncbi:MAG TPA: undecaprenyl-diphosphate phosphatase, partial [Flavobacteriales bacterium]|nr:undecaprenyl-diphosphate phosphatase [Flavobacteriales bacterium]